jgi:hypothetical protein
MANQLSKEKLPSIGTDEKIKIFIKIVALYTNVNLTTEQALRLRVMWRIWVVLYLVIWLLFTNSWQ